MWGRRDERKKPSGQPLKKNRPRERVQLPESLFEDLRALGVEVQSDEVFTFCPSSLEMMLGTDIVSG
jgi:hypothetical protein